MTQQQPYRAGDEILHPVNRKVFQRWFALYNGLNAPSRRDLDLKSIGANLSHIALIETADLAGRCRFRLAGTSLRGIFARELTSTDFFSLWSQKDRQALRAMLSIAIAETEPLSIRFSVHASATQTEAVEAILLPMRETGLIFSSFAAVAQPYWLGEHQIIKQEISSIRFVTLRDPSTRKLDPVVLISREPEDSGRVLWPGFRIISGGRK